MSDQAPLVKGTLDVLVLKALSWAPMHRDVVRLVGGPAHGAAG